MSMKVPIGKPDDNTLIAAIDIGKDTNVGYFRLRGKDLQTIRFPNTRTGFTRFYECILKFKNQYCCRRVVVGSESTGVYGVPLMHFLKDKNVEVVQVNPMHTKKIKEITDNSPNKTDDKDPRVIADIIELGRFLRVVIPEGIAADLRSLYHTREQIVEHHTAMNNQLRDHLFIIFPEFVRVFKNISSATARRIIREYPFPQDIVLLGKQGLIDVVRTTSRGRIPESKAVQLFDAAVSSVGIVEGRLGYELSVRMQLDLIEELAHHQKQIEEQIEELLKKVPESRYLLSMKGMGPITVGGLLGEFVDFNLFRTSDEVLKYAGLNLYEISSGKKSGRRQISKRGRSLVRKLLYFAVINMIRNHGAFHDLYHHHLERNSVKNRAIIAVARKLLRTLFALVKKEQMFIENYKPLHAAA